MVTMYYAVGTKAMPDEQAIVVRYTLEQLAEASSQQTRVAVGQTFLSAVEMPREADRKVRSTKPSAVRLHEGIGVPRPLNHSSRQISCQFGCGRCWPISASVVVAKTYGQIARSDAFSDSQIQRERTLQ
jgi:hypothetical protein